LKALESQLQEVKYQAKKIQAQLNSLSTVERMKRSQEQRTAQQQIHTIHRKFMEVTQRIQPIKEKAYQVFTEVEVQEEELEQVFTTAEQRLEGPINVAVIQEFVEQEVTTQQQVEAIPGVQSRASQTRVTWDKSQVSVRGMLALDQVLGDPWSCLTYFGTLTTYRRWSAR
jgi:hypothetical protein